MKFSLFSFAFSFALCAGCASAEDPQLEKVRKAVAAKLPGITAADIAPSPVPGLYQVHKGSDYGYVTSDGRYLVRGDLLDLSTDENLTEKEREGARLSVLKKFGPDQIIEFAAANPKHVITIFTDIDCGYCRKLHAEMADYNQQGISVRYLFYPRMGPNTPSFDQAKSVWCSKDRKEALTQAKAGRHINAPTTCKNPVQAQYDAGDALGINATPMMVLDDGELVRGYVPAATLAARLAQKRSTPARATSAPSAP